MSFSDCSHSDPRSAARHSGNYIVLVLIVGPKLFIEAGTKAIGLELSSVSGPEL